MTDTTWPTEAAAVVDVATRAAKPHEVGGGKVYVLVDNSGEVHTVDLDTDKYRDHPRRKTGGFVVTRPDAFAAYMEKHSREESEIWADQERASVVAVINAHTSSGTTETAGFGDHRLTLKLVKSPEWLRWTSADRKPMNQSTFAELVEDRLVDIVQPVAADMLELAQTFEAKNDVRFASAVSLSSGERQLTYKEDLEAKAGRQGQLVVPTTFTIAVRPFLGFEAWKVEARFRYQIRDGSLTISYALTRPEDVIQAAFDEVVAKIDEICDAPVYVGTSA